MASNIDGKFQYLMETKSLIKSALNEKGLTITDADTFRSYADSIRNADFKSDDVRYVTFRNGTRQLYVKPVATGDDCVDVKAKGFITTPTKASTVDKVFTYSGWAATDGGVADEGVLKSITEDKTVYAAYTDSPRYYTITYYDSDGTTVLKTESVAYGSTPNYTPKKDGHDFGGWSPSVSPVTGNASYTATWIKMAAFGTASWSDIKAVVDSGEAATTFNIGDRRTETLTYQDGTSEEVTFEIVDLALNVNAGTTPVTRLIILATHVLSKPYKFANNKTDNNSQIFMYSPIETYLNDTVYNALSEDLRGALVKLPYLASNVTYGKGNIYVTLPSGYNLFGTNNPNALKSEISDSAPRLTKFKGVQSHVCKDVNGTAREYWLSSTYYYSGSSGAEYPNYVDTNGKLKTAHKSYLATERYIRPLLVI